MDTDDQYMIDYDVDTHSPVTDDNVRRALQVLLVPRSYVAAFNAVAMFLRPKEDELDIIEKVVAAWCENMV